MVRSELQAENAPKVLGAKIFSNNRVPLPVRVVRHFHLSHDSGVQVMEVTLDTPAHAAGLKEEDVIISGTEPDGRYR